MYRKNKTICRLLAATCIFSIMGQYPVPVHAQETTETQYVILAENEENYDAVTEELDGGILENPVELAENNIIVAELTETEVDALSEMDDILVEEDIIISACTAEDDFDGVQEPSAEAKAKKEAVIQKKKDRYAMMEETLTEDANGAMECEWNLQAVNADGLSADHNDEQTKIKAAVLDSGIDYVEGINLAGFVNLVEEEQYLPDIFQDLTGHGTGIAGIIAGNGKSGFCGVDSNVELYSVRVLDKDNVSPLSRIIQGIYWCIENDMDIINMSFGTPVCSKALEKAVSDAYDANILMVAAAGNNGGAVEYPAAFDKVLAVAATGPQAEISDFSNTGTELDVAAPGEKIRTAGFFNGSVITHGTSIAVPHVTGAAALLWERDPARSSEFIRRLIRYSAKDLSGTDECGLLDVGYALEVYDSFAKSYDNGTPDEAPPENPDAPADFSYVEDDDAYVEGRWGRKPHTDPVGAYSKSLGFDTDAVRLMKRGAIFPDEKESGTQGMGAHPQWHGAFAPFDDNIHAYASKNVNYIAAVELITFIALEGGSTSSFRYDDICGMDEESFNTIVREIRNMDFNAVFGEMGIKNTKANRKYFLYGCGIHCLTDIFAHSTTASDGVFLGHGYRYSGSTDEPDFHPGRYSVAVKAAEYSLESLKDEVYTDGAEIALALKNAELNRGFKVVNLKKYAKQNESYHSIMDAKNINRADVIFKQ